MEGFRDIAASREVANTSGLQGIGGIFTCTVDAKGFGKIHKSVILASDESEAKRIYLNTFPRSSKKFTSKMNYSGEKEFTISLLTPDMAKKGARTHVELNSVDCTLHNSIQ